MPQEPALSRHTDVPTNGTDENSHGNGSTITNGPETLPVRNGGDASSSYSVRDAPFGAPRHLRIVTIGAGASGLNLIRTLRNTLPEDSFDHVVYEKNHDVGGTWLENRYPGCRCDVPSHNYQFSWRKNPEWSAFFAPAEEIHAYLAKLSDDEGMRPLIKTRHRIVGATWSESRAAWDIRVEDLETGNVLDDWAHFLIDATGNLNKWKWPDVPGREDFKGEIIHTAAWPKDFDYENKTVAVIGNGASGVQVLPAIKPSVKKLYHHIRTPTAIIPPRVPMMRLGPAAPIINQIELDDKENFTQAQIDRFKADPAFYEKFAQALELDSNVKFGLSLDKDSLQQKWAAGKLREFMTAMLRGDEELCAKLVPDYPVGCRRLTPAHGYLEAFHDPKVELRTGAIRRFTEKGIEVVRVEGEGEGEGETEAIEVDAIICATGFDPTFRPAFPLVGRSGNLQDIWTRETPKSYMSFGVADMPNYFKFLGPFAPSAHGDVFTLSEHLATHITALIAKAQAENIRTLAPLTAAVDDFAAHAAAFMPRTVFVGSCRSWYKQGHPGDQAPVIGLHPGSRMHFIAMLERVRCEDWEFTYGSDEKGAAGGDRFNRFAYLGNGFTGEEMVMMKKAAAGMVQQQQQ